MILVAFGWRKQAAGYTPGRRIFAFCILWAAAAAADWSAFGAAGSFAYVPCAILAWTGLRGLLHHEAAQTAAYGFLTGAVYALIAFMERQNPLLSFLHPAIDPAAALCALTVAYSRRPQVQFALISIGLAAGDLLLGRLFARYGPAEFGGGEFQDAWWVAVFAARSLSVFGREALVKARQSADMIRKRLRARR